MLIAKKIMNMRKIQYHHIYLLAALTMLPTIKPSFAVSGPSKGAGKGTYIFCGRNHKGHTNTTRNYSPAAVSSWVNSSSAWC